MLSIRARGNDDMNSACKYSLLCQELNTTTHERVCVMREIASVYLNMGLRRQAAFQHLKATLVSTNSKSGYEPAVFRQTLLPSFRNDFSSYFQSRHRYAVAYQLKPLLLF